MIVQKAVKDLSIEQTIKTYEEIWLSKMFVLDLYSYQKLQQEQTDQREEDVRLKSLRINLVSLENNIYWFQRTTSRIAAHLSRELALSQSRPTRARNGLASAHCRNH